jgi:hypothetical protein
MHIRDSPCESERRQILARNVRPFQKASGEVNLSRTYFILAIIVSCYRISWPPVNIFFKDIGQ